MHLRIITHARLYDANLRNDIVYVHKRVCVPYPVQCIMNFFSFSIHRFSKRLNSTLLPYAYVLHCHHGMDFVDTSFLILGSELQKIKKRTSELSCHEESTEDEDFLAYT